MIDQQAAHSARGDAVKVAAVLPVDVHADQLLVSLVYECGGLQGVSRVLAADLALCIAFERFVHDWRERIQRGFVAGTPVLQQLRYGLV